MLKNSLPHAHKWSIHCVQLLRILDSYVAMVPVVFVPMKTTVRGVAGHWSGFQGCLGGNTIYNVLVECRLWWGEPECTAWST